MHSSHMYSIFYINVNGGNSYTYYHDDFGKIGRVFIVKFQNFSKKKKYDNRPYFSMEKGFVRSKMTKIRLRGLLYTDSAPFRLLLRHYNRLHTKMV